MSITILRRVLFALVPLELALVILIAAGVTIPNSVRVVILTLLTATLVAEASAWTLSFVRRRRSGLSVVAAAMDATRHVIGERLWGFIRAEFSLVPSLGRLVLRRPSIRPGSVAVTYHRESAAMMWAMTGVILLEIVAFHVLIPWPTIRVIALVLSVYSLIWVVGFIAGFAVYPHLLDTQTLRVRHGPTVEVAVPLAQVERIDHRARDLTGVRSIRYDDSPQALEGPALHIAQGGRTNLDLTLTEAVGGWPAAQGRKVGRLHFWADDPQTLIQSLRAMSREA